MEPKLPYKFRLEVDGTVTPLPPPTPEELAELRKPPASFPIPILTDMASTEAFLARPGRVALWFFASWGGPDRMTQQLLEGIPVERRRAAALAAIEVFGHFGADERFQLTHFPMFIVFQDGAEIRRIRNFLNLAELTALLAEVTAPSPAEAR